LFSWAQLDTAFKICFILSMMTVSGSQ